MTIPPAGPEIRAGDDGSDNPNFKLVRFRKIKLDRHPPYLVRGLIPRKGLIVVYGPPKCGKTFIVFDLCMHIALGWEYRDRCTQPGNVVYIACEGERGLAARKEAFQQQKLGEEADPPFYLITSKLNLPVQHAELILDISGQLPPGESCVAIVLDTLNRSIGGSENKDEDMTAYITAADALRERFRCAVIIIHHTGINQTRPRGHTSLTGAADAQIAVRREDSDACRPPRNAHSTSSATPLAEREKPRPRTITSRVTHHASMKTYGDGSATKGRSRKATHPTPNAKPSTAPQIPSSPPGSSGSGEIWCGQFDITYGF